MATPGTSGRRGDMGELIAPEDAAAAVRSEYARMRSNDEPAALSSTPTQSMRIRLRKQKSAGDMNAALRGSEVEGSASQSPYQALDQSHAHHHHHPHALVDKVKKHMHLDRARCK